MTVWKATEAEKMTVYAQIVDSIAQDKKNTVAGQMSLFDFAEEDVKKDFEIRMPDVGEYDKDTLLSYEKEDLGIYLQRTSSGTLQQYDGKNHLCKNNGFPGG